MHFTAALRGEVAEEGEAVWIVIWERRGKNVDGAKGVDMDRGGVGVTVGPGV